MHGTKADLFRDLWDGYQSRREQGITSKRALHEAFAALGPIVASEQTEPAHRAVIAPSSRPAAEAREEAERERDELRAAVERTRETLAHLEGQRMRDWQERRAGGGNPNIHQSYYLGQSDAYGDALERLSRETRGLR